MSAERLPMVSERRTWTATAAGYSEGNSGEGELDVLVRWSRTCLFDFATLLTGDSSGSMPPWVDLAPHSTSAANPLRANGIRKTRVRVSSPFLNHGVYGGTFVWTLRRVTVGNWEITRNEKTREERRVFVLQKSNIEFAKDTMKLGISDSEKWRLERRTLHGSQQTISIPKGMMDAKRPTAKKATSSYRHRHHGVRNHWNMTPTLYVSIFEAHPLVWGGGEL